MERELNTPAEMGRRLLYVAYLLLCTAVFILLIFSLIKAKVSYLLYALLLSGCCILFKSYGNKELNFTRLSASFPHGHDKDFIAAELVQEAEALLKHFSDHNTGWIERQALRNRLTELLALEPRLYEIYKQEITAIHPTLAASLLTRQE